MLVATHMLAGTAIYEFTGRRKVISIPLAFGSHFLLDSIYHFELNMRWNIFLGLTIICFLLFISYLRKDLFILITGFLGALPDIMWVLNISPTFNKIHSYLHFWSPNPIPLYYLYIEALLACLFIFMVSNKTKVFISKQ